MAAFLLSIIRSSHCLFSVCATVSEVGFCCQATTGHSSPNAVDFCFYPSEKKYKMNEYTDMPVLAPVHTAVRCLSLSPAQEEHWEGRKPSCPCTTQTTSAAGYRNKRCCVLCGVVRERWSLPTASQCLRSSRSHFPFQGMLWVWELASLQLHKHGRRFASALMAGNEITTAHVEDRLPLAYDQHSGCCKANGAVTGIGQGNAGGYRQQSAGREAWHSWPAVLGDGGYAVVASF